MADQNEIVNIVGFDFDTSKLEQSVQELEGQLRSLREEQGRYITQGKAYQNEIKAIEAEQRRLTTVNQQGGQAFSDNKKRLEELRASIDRNISTQQGLRTQIGLVNTEYGRQNRTYTQRLDLEGRLLTSTDLYNRAMSMEITSINSAREANEKILKLRNQLNPAIAQEAEMIKKLNERYDENTRFVRENASEYEQMKMSIGDYRNQIVQATGDLSLMNGGLVGFIGRAQQAGGVSALFKGALVSMTTAMGGMIKASLAFIATPIGALLAVLVGAFMLVKNAMNRSEEATDKITRIFSSLGAIVQKLLGWLEPLGDFIINGLVVYFETLAKVAESVMGILADAMEFIGMEESAKGIRDFTQSIKEAGEAGAKLADMEADLTVQMREARKIQLEYQRDAEKLRQIRDDQTKSTKERIKANDDLGVSLKKQAESELKIANLQLKVAEEKTRQGGKNAENLDREAEALTNIADIQERINGQSSEQIRNRTTLIKEANAKQIESTKKKNEAIIKGLEIELKAFELNEGKKKLSYENSIATAEGVQKRQLAIAEKQYKSGIIKLKEYELRKLEITTEFESKRLDSQMKVLNDELALFKQANQRKLNDNQFFNDELFYQEIDRINRVNEAEKKALDERYANNLLSKAEYDLAYNQLDIDAQNQRDATFKEREDAKKQTEAIDEAVRLELKGEQDKYNMQASLDAFDNDLAIRREKAIAMGVNMTEWDKNEARKRKEIERSVMDNKLELASNTLSQMSAIFGEESKAGKAMAIAQTTIDTYRSAQSAYAGMIQTIPGPVGIALGAVAAGASIAVGLANVKKITAVKDPTPPKTPNFARGVIGLSGAGTGTSDSINANLSRGESVINAQSTAMFPNTLSDINMLGGGNGIDSNSVIQNGILSDATNGNMAQMIAEAVAIGAEAGTLNGSQKGFVELSNNREIERNAKY